MRFFEEGRMLYSLDVAAPEDMARLLQSGLPVRNRIYEGSYLLRGSLLSVRVICFVLNGWMGGATLAGTFLIIIV